MKIFETRLRFAAIVVFLMASGTALTSAQEMLAEANRLYGQGRFEEALEFAKVAEERFPGKVETWNLLGKIYLEQGAAIERFTGFAGLFRRDLLGEAEEAFRKALMIDPASVDDRNHLAFTLFLLKNIPAARDQLEQVLAIQPDDAYANYLSGEIDLRLEEPGKAAARFSKALDADPGFVDARAGLIRAYLAAERLDEAGKEVVELLKQAPELPQVLGFAFQVYESKNLLTEAAALYQSLLDVEPRRQDIRFQLATVAYRLSLFDESEALLDAMLAADSKQAGALYYKAAHEIRRNRLDEAIALLERAAQLESDFNTRIMEQLHYIALRWADERGPDACLEILDFILDCNPVDTDAAANKALTLSRWGRIDEADRAYKGLIAMDPWDSSAVNNYALHLMGTGRTGEALAMLEKAVEVDGNLDALENLGSYHYYTEENGTVADTYFRKVLKSDPERTKSLILHKRITAAGRSGGD